MRRLYFSDGRRRRAQLNPHDILRPSIQERGYKGTVTGRNPGGPGPSDSASTGNNGCPGLSLLREDPGGWQKQ